jgi:hypothetical protein
MHIAYWCQLSVGAVKCRYRQQRRIRRGSDAITVKEESDLKKPKPPHQLVSQ